MSAPVQVTGLDAVLEEIRVAMARKKWRQSDLARALGEQEWRISRLINGKQTMTLIDLLRIADALEVPPRTLFPETATRWYTGLRSLSLDGSRRRRRAVRCLPPHEITRSVGLPL